MTLKIADKEFKSRLFLGTGKFASNALMREAVSCSETELVTVALKRLRVGDAQDEMLRFLDLPGVALLPNTSGARTAKEAILAANLAREALQTNWIKLEIHPDPNYLLPDPIETYEAVKVLVDQGFVVLPYIPADPVLCKRLEDVGVQAVMPLGAPIGSNLGLRTKDMLRIIIDQSLVPVVIDAGIGTPSHAAAAMEMGADAVLVNTAIAVSHNPVLMAKAFKTAVESGRQGLEANFAPQSRRAIPSSPNSLFG